MIIKLVQKNKISGFVVSNLSNDRTGLKARWNYKGGISGKPVKDKANNMIKYIYKKTKGNLTIIAVGGIFSAEDAYTAIKNGASLVQLITGMFYKGPGLIADINKGLVKLLKQDGYKNIKQAIGMQWNKKQFWY